MIFYLLLAQTALWFFMLLLDVGFDITTAGKPSLYKAFGATMMLTNIVGWFVYLTHHLITTGA